MTSQNVTSAPISNYPSANNNWIYDNAEAITLVSLGSAAIIGAFIAGKFAFSYDSPFDSSGKYPTYSMSKAGTYKDQSYILEGNEPKKVSPGTANKKFSVQYLKDGGSKSTFDQFDRQSYEVTVHTDGTLYWKYEGKVWNKTDTNQPISHKAGDPVKLNTNSAGEAGIIGVMDSAGNIFISQKHEFIFQHSSFLAGNPVATAFSGTLRADGKILGLTNHSGHYVPNSKMMSSLKSELKQRGVNNSHIDSMFRPTETSYSPTLRARIGLLLNKIILYRAQPKERPESLVKDLPEVKMAPGFIKKFGSLGAAVGFLVGGITTDAIGASSFQLADSCPFNQSTVDFFAKLTAVKDSLDLYRDQINDLDVELSSTH